MKVGTVPSSWLSITNNWTAEAQLRLLEEVDRLKIDHHDLPAVKQVWHLVEAERKSAISQLLKRRMDIHTESREIGKKLRKLGYKNA